MKELSIEEKAKAYDEAIKIAKSKIKNDKDHILYEDDITEIFPELKESEDERVRKYIINHLQEHLKTVREFLNNGMSAPFSSEEIKMLEASVAWLEKQGEHQMFVNKEYTFKAIPRLLEMIQPTDRAKSYCQKLIDSLEQEGYSTDAKIVREYLKLMNGEKVPMATMDEQKPVDKIEPKFKVGDWIVNNNSGGVYQVTEIRDDEYCLWPLYDEIMGYLRIIDVDSEYHLWTIQDAKDGDVLFIGLDGSTCIFKKLEGNLLYSYIISDGKLLVEDSHYYYETSDNVHPATKEQRDLLFQKMSEASYEWDTEKKELKKIEQNLAWSEEDEDAIGMAIIALEDMYDEDAPNTTYGGYNLPFNKAAERLKSLKGRVQPPNQEWSEEDEKIYSRIYDLVHDAAFANYDVDEDGKELGEYAKITNWFKALKLRNTWKPSDEQMDMLKIAVSTSNSIVLDSLYNDLMKLKE